MFVHLLQNGCKKEIVTNNGLSIFCSKNVLKALCIYYKTANNRFPKIAPKRRIFRKRHVDPSHNPTAQWA